MTEQTPRQLSEADMKSMTPEQIVTAYDNGQFDQLIAGK